MGTPSGRRRRRLLGWPAARPHDGAPAFATPGHRDGPKLLNGPRVVVRYGGPGGPFAAHSPRCGSAAISYPASRDVFGLARQMSDARRAGIQTGEGALALPDGRRMPTLGMAPGDARPPIWGRRDDASGSRNRVARRVAPHGTRASGARRATTRHAPRSVGPSPMGRSHEDMHTPGTTKPSRWMVHGRLRRPRVSTNQGLAGVAGGTAPASPWSRT